MAAAAAAAHAARKRNEGKQGKRATVRRQTVRADPEDEDELEQSNSAVSVASRKLRQTIQVETQQETVRCPCLMPLWKYQEPVGRFYKSHIVELVVAGLIVGNFITNMFEKTIDPDPDNRKYEDLWVFFDYFYNAAFTVELALNMYAFWLWDFWKSGWNQFDFLVVSIGLMTVFEVPLPGPLKLLRMMRAFRVFRIFKRIESLRKIMQSLAHAVPGVTNAFIILLLITCIYASLAVEFFRTFGEGGFFKNERGYVIPLMTARDLEYGYNYFGNFPKSLFTMFQVMTGESWVEAIVRFLIHGEDILQNVAFALFFVSFVVLTSVVLINVVVAVLLEKMVDDPAPPEEYDGPPAPMMDIATLTKEVVAVQSDLSTISEQLALVITAIKNQKQFALGQVVSDASIWEAPKCSDTDDFNDCVRKPDNAWLAEST